MISAPDERILQALMDVEDPELPISIVDMGLIVDAQQRGTCATVKITFTSMGCPAMDMIIDDVKERLQAEPGVERVDVEVVWDPIWNPTRLSADGVAQLREWGISV